MNKFYIDIDGCIRNLVAAVDRLYCEQHPGEEPEVVPVYDLAMRYPRWWEDIWDIVFRQHVDRLFNFDAEQYPGAIDAVNWLHNQDEAKVALLSKQSDSRIAATDLWLDAQGLDPTIERMYVDQISKGEYILGADDALMTFLIDDSPDEIESVSGVVDYPIMVSRPWNKTFREGNPNTNLLTNVDVQALKAMLAV